MIKHDAVTRSSRRGWLRLMLLASALALSAQAAEAQYYDGPYGNPYGRNPYYSDGPYYGRGYAPGYGLRYGQDYGDQDDGYERPMPRSRMPAAKPKAAPKPAATALSPLAVVRSLKQQGFEQFANLKRTGKTYSVEATDGQGQRLQLSVDAVEGRVVSRKRVGDQRSSMDDAGAQSLQLGASEDSESQQMGALDSEDEDDLSAGKSSGALASAEDIDDRALSSTTNRPAITPMVPDTPSMPRQPSPAAPVQAEIAPRAVDPPPAIAARTPIERPLTQSTPEPKRPAADKAAAPQPTVTPAKPQKTVAAEPSKKPNLADAVDRPASRVRVIEGVTPLNVQ